MATPIRPKDLIAGTPTAGADLIFDSGTEVLRCEPLDLVNAATPLASQAEAEAGTDNAKRVTSLRVAQAVEAQAITPLASVAGASLIGNLGGGTVQDSIFKKGPNAAVVAAVMATDWLKFDAGTDPTTWGGLWVDKTYAGLSFAKEFTASNAPVNTPNNSPTFAALFSATASGAQGDVCGLGVISFAKTTDSTVFGANILAGTTGDFPSKLVGLEIDLAFSAGATASAGSGGLYLNVFNVPDAGPAIQVGAVNGGSWTNGIDVGGIASTGACLLLSGTANSLINSTVGTYTGAAITLGATRPRGILFQGTGAASIYGDGVNIRNVLPAAGGWVWRNNADSASLASLDSGGNINLEAGGSLGFTSAVVTGSSSSGAAALPANPVGFISVLIAGTLRKVPFYAA